MANKLFYLTQDLVFDKKTMFNDFVSLEREINPVSYRDEEGEVEEGLDAELSLIYIQIAGLCNSILLFDHLFVKKYSLSTVKDIMKKLYSRCLEEIQAQDRDTYWYRIVEEEMREYANS